MSVQRLSHIGICVSALERSLVFYRDVLGFQELSGLTVTGPQAEQLLDIEGVELQAVYLERDGTRIELLYYRAGGHSEPAGPGPMNRLGLTHLSFRVADIDAIVEAAQQAGGECLRTSMVANEAWHTKAVFITDPDGLRIELLQTPGDPNALPGS